MAMISAIEDYFALGCGRCERHATADCSTRRWSGGLRQLRRICREAGLAETVKWGHPCYVHAGRNVVIIGALRSDFRLSFMNAALMGDPAGILLRQGPNTRHPDTVRFTAEDEVVRLEPILCDYLAEAMGYARDGVKPAIERDEPDPPDALVLAMAGDPDLAAAFARLTPGRRRSHVLALASAKSEATQVARIGRLRERILAGKGATER